MPDNPQQRIDALFPESDPYATGRLPVDARHALYWETCGNAIGVPLVFLLMGPLMVEGSYFAVSGEWSLTAIVLSIPIRDRKSVV